jgi:hypothetical protein
MKEMSNPNDVRKGSTQEACMDQNLIVSPPNIISPVGDRMRYFPRAVGPCDEAICIPKEESRTKNVNLCA